MVYMSVILTGKTKKLVEQYFGAQGNSGSCIFWHSKEGLIGALGILITGFQKRIGRTILGIQKKDGQDKGIPKKQD